VSFDRRDEGDGCRVLANQLHYTSRDEYPSINRASKKSHQGVRVSLDDVMSVASQRSLHPTPYTLCRSLNLETIPHRRSRINAASSLAAAATARSASLRACVARAPSMARFWART
jgi:hypothetical protein